MTVAQPVITRCFQKYDSTHRAERQASHRLGYLQKQAVGEFYYVNSLRLGVCFETRGAAIRATPEKVRP